MTDSRTYAHKTCPTCRATLDPLPKAKKRCQSCGETIYVRCGPDGLTYLLRTDELPGVERAWARDAAWWAAHEALPPYWRVEPLDYDPDRHVWTVIAGRPDHGRNRNRKLDMIVCGTGEDEIAALRDLDGRLRALPRPADGTRKRAASNQRAQPSVVGLSKDEELLLFGVLYGDRPRDRLFPPLTRVTVEDGEEVIAVRHPFNVPLESQPPWYTSAVALYLSAGGAAMHDLDAHSWAGGRSDQARQDAWMTAVTSARSLSPIEWRNALGRTPKTREYRARRAAEMREYRKRRASSVEGDSP